MGKSVLIFLTKCKKCFTFFDKKRKVFFFLQMRKVFEFFDKMQRTIRYFLLGYKFSIVFCSIKSAKNNQGS